MVAEPERAVVVTTKEGRVRPGDSGRLEGGDGGHPGQGGRHPQVRQSPSADRRARRGAREPAGALVRGGSPGDARARDHPSRSRRRASSSWRRGATTRRRRGRRRRRAAACGCSSSTGFAASRPAGSDPTHSQREEPIDEDRARGSAALRRWLAAVDLRPRRDRRRAGRLGRVQRQPEPARHRRLRAGHGASPGRSGPAAGGAPVLGHAAPHAPEPRRRHPQGHRRRRAGALGHQGEGPRRAGLRAVRRADARPRAPLLVALRHHARAPGPRARHAAAAHLRRHRRARHARW